MNHNTPPMPETVKESLRKTSYPHVSAEFAADFIEKLTEMLPDEPAPAPTPKTYKEMVEWEMTLRY